MYQVGHYSSGKSSIIFSSEAFTCMQRFFALVVLGLFILMGGCLSQTAQPLPSQAPPNAVCGDGACGLGENASCCPDCGCPADFLCDNKTGRCQPGPDYIFKMGKGVSENITSYSSDSSLRTHAAYNKSGTIVSVTIDISMEEEVDLLQQREHLYMTTGNGTTETYAIGNTSYFYYPDYGWAKDSLDPSFWSDVNDSGNELWALATSMKHTLNGSSSVGGRDCWLLSFSVTLQSQNRKMKEMLVKSGGEGSAFLEQMNDLAIDSWNMCIDKKNYELLSSDLTISGSANDVSVNMQLDTLYDNNPAVIALPPAVRNAKALPFELKYYPQYCAKIDPRSEVVRQGAAIAAAAHPGSLSVTQYADLYQYVHTKIAYVSDPSRPDLESYPYAPDKTLLAGAGDCDDQAILLASMIEAIGGYSRVVINPACGHVWVEAYVGNSEADVNSAKESLFAYYPYDITVRWRTDDDGTKWLVLDPAGGQYAGDLHPSCYSQTADNSWVDIGTKANVYNVYSCVQ